jgi:hypothetical protein
MVDSAFRPSDLTTIGGLDKESRRTIKGALLKPSATVHLKQYARYSDALWKFFGESSRAVGICQWTRKTMEEFLPAIVENLDQVYGVTVRPISVPNLGKHMVGLMLMRTVHCKSLAAALESASSGLFGGISTVFGEAKSRPFFELRQTLYGENFDARTGFFSHLAGGRTRFVLSNSLFKREVEGLWHGIWDILITSDQTPEGRRQQKLMNIVGFGFDTASVIASAAGPSGRKK